MLNSLRLLAAIAVTLALTIFLARHQDTDPSVWITVLILMLVIFVPYSVPAVGTFVADRPRTVIWTGRAMMAGGLAAMVGIIVTGRIYKFPSDIIGAAAMAMISIIMAGVALTVLPRSMAALQREEKASATFKAGQRLKRKFTGVDEAWTALLTVVRNVKPVLRLIGPWIVLLWAVPFVGLRIAAVRNGIAPDLSVAPLGKIDVPTELFGETLPILAASAFVIPIVLVGWHRYVLTGAVPKFPSRPPLGAMARYFWRLWIIVALFSVLIGLVTSKAPVIARFLGTADERLVADLLFWCVLCVEVHFGSSYALVLPAIAEGNRDFLGTDSVRMSRPLGNSYRIGFALSLMPFGLAGWGTVALLNRLAISGPGLSLASYTLWLVPTAMMFLALASCATYLSRIYAAQSRTKR